MVPYRNFFPLFPSLVELQSINHPDSNLSCIFTFFEIHGGRMSSRMKLILVNLPLCRRRCRRRRHLPPPPGRHTRGCWQILFKTHTRHNTHKCMMVHKIGAKSHPWIFNGVTRSIMCPGCCWCCHLVVERIQICSSTNL